MSYTEPLILDPIQGELRLAVQDDIDELLKYKKAFLHLYKNTQHIHEDCYLILKGDYEPKPEVDPMQMKLDIHMRQFEVWMRKVLNEGTDEMYRSLPTNELHNLLSSSPPTVEYKLITDEIARRIKSESGVTNMLNIDETDITELSKGVA